MIKKNNLISVIGALALVVLALIAAIVAIRSFSNKTKNTVPLPGTDPLLPNKTDPAGTDSIKVSEPEVKLVDSAVKNTSNSTDPKNKAEKLLELLNGIPDLEKELEELSQKKAANLKEIKEKKRIHLTKYKITFLRRQKLQKMQLKKH